MKFFSRLFGKNTSFPKPKNNFEFIALNLALIYYVLNNSYKEYFDDEEQLLIASGVIDALVYIKDGTITLDDIRYAIRFARQGKCSLFLSEYMHEENVSEVGLFLG